MAIQPVTADKGDITDSKPTVLVAGISGELGTKIANAILDKGVMNVKGLVRSDSSKLDDLKTKGIEFAEGDLFDPLSLSKACNGVEVIAFAVREIPVAKLVCTAKTLCFQVS